MANSRAISTFSTESLPETDVRCSIIVPAGNDLSMLNSYLLFLNQAQFPCDYEIVIANDRGLHIDEKLLDRFSLAVKILNLDTQLGRGQLFSKGAVAARGKFLLFIREFVKFDKLVLEEAIREIDESEDKISVSEKGSFLLVESSFCISNEIIMQIIKETDENTPLDQIIGLLRANKLAAQWTCQDQRMLDFYSQFISSGYLCFDVGANIGNRTKIFLKLGAKVVAVEPQDDCVRCLKVSYGRNDNFRIIQKVLGESQGWAELMVCNASTISSMSREWIDSVKKSGRFRNYSWDKTQTVSMTTLDQLIEEYGIPAFTKIDVEGFEYEVLKGLSKPLKVLSLEFTPEFIASTFKCIEHLQSLGRIQLNYSLGETMQLVLDKWINPKEMVETLKNLGYDNKTFGDVYVRFLDRTSESKINVSANGNFLPAESSFYLPKINLDGGGERVDIFYGANLVFDLLDMYQKSHYRRYEFAKSVISPGKIIGDFACGTGYGSIMLSENAHLVIGADIDKDVIEQIRRRYAGVKNTEFVCSNLLNLTYQSFFDCIVAFETIEHLMEADIPRLFAIFARALKPGGMLVFSTPYKQPKSPEAVNMGFHQTFDIDEEKIRRWLSENGLVPEYFKYQNYQTHNIEDRLSRKDFIICLARTCKDSVIKEHMPKVSILIPTFNRANYLKMAVESALAQTYPNTEVLVLDDCSTDETVNLSRTYRNATNVKFVRNETNIGFIDNWNKAVSLSCGEYIKIMGDDDILSPECVAEQVRILDEHPDVGVVCCNLSVIDEDSRLKNGNNLYKLFSRDMKENGQEFIKNYLLGKRAVGWPTAILFRRRDIDEVGYFDIEAGCAADIDMWCRILRVKDFYYLDKMLAYNRQFPGNLSRKLQANDFGYKDILYFYLKMAPCVEHILDEHTNRQIWSTLITKILPFYSKAQAQNKTVIKRDIDSLMVRQAHHPEQTCPERGRESRGTERCYPGQTHSPARLGKNTTALIFSKDRAMQLQAMIESFLLYCSDHDNIYLTVLYKASSELHAGQYAELRSKFPGINFVEESNFREQVLSVLQKCDYILFLVDDNIFIRHFCIGDITAALYRETDAIGFSLRLGENTTYCYMAGTIQKQPRFERLTDSILKYDWTVAEHDYNYPLEVSSSIYRSNEIVDFLSDGDFSNPNTLEIQMVSAEQFKRTRPKLLCFHTSVVFCNPANKVQNVCEQNRSGMNENYCSESLAQIYQQGMVIDVGKYDGFVSNGAHQEVRLYFKQKPDERIRISVIIPCYNHAHYLPQAVESIINQTYTNWECIIVNDGSNDNTAEAAKQLIAKYPDREIRFIDKPNNSGLADTRNVGIEAATSEWILPLDSDDMFERTFMQRAVDIIHREEKVDIIFANMQEFGASNGEWIPREYSREQIMVADTMPYASLYRKELWQKVGGYDKLVGAINQPEDWNFWISCSKYELVVKRIPEKLFLYRVDHQSMYHKMIKPNREVSWALLATCHPDLYPPQTLVDAWQLIANCPDNIYEKILIAPEKCPEYGLAYFWRALINKKQGNIDDAIKDCNTALERAKENDWQSAFVLMYWQNSLGDMISAAESLEKLLNIRPDFRWAKDILKRPQQKNDSKRRKLKILFYFDRIGSFNETSPAGTVIAILNFARALQSSNPDVEIHITGDLVHYAEQYESFRVIPLPRPEQREQFITDYDVVFFATHVRYFKGLTRPQGQIWILWQHCWQADDLASLSHMSDFDIVVCLSELHRASLHNRSIGDEKLMIIPNLIDANVYSPKAVSRNNHSIMYAGALHPHKCVHILMDAFRLVRRQISDAELHIYGDGSMWRGGDVYGDNLKSAKPEGTYFHGYVNNKDMPEIYSKHSMLCLPSKFESFGLVIVEAQACGCIPVAHNAGGAAVTLVDGQTGLLYSPNTPEKLAETIIAGFRMVDSDPSIRHRAVDFIRENFSTNRAPEYISRLWDRINIAREVNTIRTLLENNDAELADLKCEKLLQKYPNHPDALLLQALIMNRQGNELKANAQIGELLEKFPNYIRALNDCGLMAMKAGDTKNAISFFTKAYKFNPWDKNTITNCYTILKISGNYRQAKILLLNYLTNIGVDAQMLYLLGEIDAFNTNAGSAVNIVSQQLVNNKQSVVYCQDSTSKPLVSIIMPVYNGADYIGQAIESVLIQNYRNFELIIVNDGSTDRTEEIIKSFKDERIRYFLKENSGPSAARNLGIRHARGEFIVTFDSDDMVTPDFIARHLQEFQEHPEADLVYCDDCLIDENDKPIRIINRPEYKNRKLLIRDLFRAGFPVVPFRTTCIRKSVFDKIGLFDERLLVAEDYDMVRRFVKNGLNMHHFAEPIYLRRMTPNSLSRKSTAEKAKIHFDVVKRFTDTFTYDELFPDVAWDKIPAGQRQLHARCLAAVTFLAIGQSYVESNSPVCAKTAFDEAYSDLKDCLAMDPDNRLFQQLLHKFGLIRTEYAPAMQQVAK